MLQRPRRGARRRCSRRHAPTRPTPATGRSGFPTRATPTRLAEFLAGDAPTVLYFGKLLYNKGVHVLLEAMRGVDARTLVVGFGDYRRELERIAPPRTLFTGPLEHRHLVHLIPLADVCVVPSIFPEAFGMVAAEAAAAGCPPLVARHSGLEEVAEGIEAAYPPEYRHLASFETGDSLDLADKLHELLALPRGAPPRARRGRTRRRGREMVVGGRRRRPSSLQPSSIGSLTSMGEAQKLPYDELIRRSREDFDGGTDFTRRGRGGVRAPRPRDAVARQPLRGGEGGRGRHRRSTSTSSAS